MWLCGIALVTAVHFPGGMRPTLVPVPFVLVPLRSVLVAVFPVRSERVVRLVCVIAAMLERTSSVLLRPFLGLHRKCVRVRFLCLLCAKWGTH